MKAQPRVRWAWMLVAALVAMIACGPDELEPPFYFEDFETLCEGVPCGWERTSGDASQVTWVETIHAGEHGLRLDGTASVRGPGSEPTGAFPLDSLSLDLTARCDAGSVLEIDLVLADEAGRPFSASALAAPAEEWSRSGALEITAETALANATRVMAIGITKTGAGACEVSDIVVDARVFTPGC